MVAVDRIYVKKLWGTLTFDWRISQDVVVLAGGNGTGKSTILRSMAYKLRDDKIPPRYEGIFEDMTIGVVGRDKASRGGEVNKSVGDTAEVKRGRGDGKIRVEANFFEFEPKGLAKDNRFCDLIDDVFSSGQCGGHKKIVRGADGGLRFALPNGFVLNFDQLSAGEQEVVRIYGRAVGMGEGDIYVLDEPETSLHIDWQEDLLDNLLELGKGMQMIVSTHSPSIVLNGWVANVIQIERLFF